MVLKKKKKKGSKSKKRKSKSVGPDQDEGDLGQSADPSTLMSGATQTDSPGKSASGKKKKVKKKKLTKEERAQEKLEKNMDKIRKEPEIFTNFVNRMDRWLKGVAPRAKEMFKKIDQEGEGIISYAVFKSGMFDLSVPVNKIELHLLATLLDTDHSGDIDYNTLEEGLQHVRDGEEDDDEEDEEDAGEEEGGKEEEKTPVFIPPPKPQLILTDRKVKNSPYKEKNPRFSQIELRLVTFDKMKGHPGHVSILVHSHLHVFGLIQLLVHLTKVQSTKVTVFRDKTRSKDARLPPTLTLEDCGYLGGLRDHPQEVTLYYDYSVEFTQCPILICDHYFGQSIAAA